MLHAIFCHILVTTPAKYDTRYSSHIVNQFVVSCLYGKEVSVSLSLPIRKFHLFMLLPK